MDVRGCQSCLLYAYSTYFIVFVSSLLSLYGVVYDTCRSRLQHVRVVVRVAGTPNIYRAIELHNVDPIWTCLIKSRSKDQNTLHKYKYKRMQ